MAWKRSGEFESPKLHGEHDQGVLAQVELVDQKPPSGALASSFYV
jgi:hypothetical protein